MRTRSSLLVLAAFAVLGALPVACGGAKKPAEDASEAMGTSSADDSTPSTPETSSATPAASGSSDAPALGAVFNTASSSDQKVFEALSSAPAAKLDKAGLKGKDPLAKKIRDAAGKAAPGMKADGPLARASLKEGERAQMDVSFEAGKCYSVVGAGDANVKDLDLQLMVAPGVMSAQDPTDDETPVIGKTPSPFCPDATTSYKLGLYAEKGGGDVAAQVYSAKKK